MSHAAPSSNDAPAGDVRFPCYLVTKDAAGVRGEITTKSIDELPPGELLIRVAYSSLNFKDALSATGNPAVTRKFPHVPGIDAAGTVVAVANTAGAATEIRVGDAVVVTGHDLGQNTWGGMAGYVRVPAAWAVKLPSKLDPRAAMIYGTAGLTAAQCVEALIARGVAPASGEVVVTGASGGVGSIAVGLLAKLGYEVTAVTGKAEAKELLTKLGAKQFLARADVEDATTKPLLKTRFAGAVDTVGGITLATLVRSMNRMGVVAACGLVGGVDVPLTVMPFILRGVDLVGIDSVECPQAQRERIWSNLADAWRLPLLAELATEAALADVPAQVERILKGGVTGRVIVRPTA
ncbi:MAG: YhdH/YhfP family quinone oxidoreductase [Planctomycetia bacterium]|nr:YhdH/YhfP family quinone oxidoreductase [Planctomycetia bacterium]